jgi:Predicted RNA-binding protein
MVMEKFVFEGKSEEDALESAKTELMVNNDEIFYNVLSEEKGGLFKSKKVSIEVTKKTSVIEFIKEYIKEITKLMGIDANLETREREGNLSITIYSDNNNVLIGKNGKNMDALSVIVRQAIYMELGRYYNFNLDIGEYKVKQQRNLESFAKQIARDVYKSKVEAKLDPMNSYERRIIHNILNDDKRVYTESVGEEPNRCIVVKPKEE